MKTLLTDLLMRLILLLHMIGGKVRCTAYYRYLRILVPGPGISGVGGIKSIAFRNLWNQNMIILVWDHAGHELYTKEWRFENTPSLSIAMCQYLSPRVGFLQISLEDTCIDVDFPYLGMGLVDDNEGHRRYFFLKGTSTIHHVLCSASCPEFSFSNLGSLRILQLD